VKLTDKTYLEFANIEFQWWNDHICRIEVEQESSEESEVKEEETPSSEGEEDK